MSTCREPVMRTYGMQDSRVYHAVTSRTARYMTTLCGLVHVPVTVWAYQSEGTPSPLCLACARVERDKLNGGFRRRQRYACRECRKLSTAELPMQCGRCGAMCCAHKGSDKTSWRSGLCPKCKEKSK